MAYCTETMKSLTFYFCGVCITNVEFQQYDIDTRYCYMVEIISYKILNDLVEVKLLNSQLARFPKYDYYMLS